MAKIRGLELPPEYNEGLIDYVNSFDDEFMSFVGKKLLPGGNPHPHQARERLREMARSSAEMEPWFYMLLEKSRAGRGCMDLLSLTGIQKFVPAALKLWPEPLVIIGLLLDPRKEVQNYGAEIMTRRLALVPASLDEATRQLGRDEILDFVNHGFLSNAYIEANIGPMHPVPRRLIHPDGTVMTRQEFMKLFGATNKAMGKLLAERNQLIRNLQDQKARHKTRLDTITREASAERSRLLTERNQALAKARRAEKEKAILTERLHKAESRLTSGIARGVAEQTSAALRKWLETPLAVEQTVRSISNDSDDLLARAEEILRQQTAQDALAGTVNDLEDRLASLESAKRRLTAAALNALHLVPELNPLLMDIDQQIQSARKALGLETEIDPVTQRLLLTINRAANPEQARECSRLIEQSIDLDLIPRADRRRLMDALQRKFSLLEELARGERLSASDPGWALRGIIHRDQPSFLLLDGFNILHAMGDTFRADYEPNGRPGRRAVEKLISLLRVLADPRPHVRIRVVLDSPHRQVIELTPNLTVEYSGGTGQNRADQRIAELIEFRRPEELEEKWFVITNDREVRRRAVASQAQPVLVDVFSVLLHDYVCQREISPTTPSLNSYAA